MAIVLLWGASLVEAGSPGAVCRVQNQLPGFVNVGSGTLVDVANQGREGLVLTCWHIFREGTGKVVVQFPDGRRHGARLVAMDQRADLAALVIANPRSNPAPVSYAFDQQSRLHACGYGQSGRLRCVVGSYAGENEANGQRSMLVSGAVRSGDSGGGVFNEHGELVAVIWGERDGVTYASCGRPLRNFLGRVIGRQRPLATCPNGLCPREPTPAQPLVPIAVTPADPGTGEHSIINDPRFEQLQAAVDDLRIGKQDRGDYLTASDLAELRTESSARHESLLARMRDLTNGREPTWGQAAGAAAAGLLGLSGPAGWAVIAGTTAGGWLLGRYMTRKFGGAGGRRHPFRKQG